MKYTVGDIHEIVEQDGLGYAIHSGVSSERISDPVLRTLWEDAKELLAQIEQYLEDNHNEPFESDDEDEEEDY